jgi:hypothetical protein
VSHRTLISSSWVLPVMVLNFWILTRQRYHCCWREVNLLSVFNSLYQSSVLLFFSLLICAYISSTVLSDFGVANHEVVILVTGIVLKCLQWSSASGDCHLDGIFRPRYVLSGPIMGLKILIEHKRMITWAGYANSKFGVSISTPFSRMLLPQMKGIYKDTFMSKLGIV